MFVEHELIRPSSVEQRDYQTNIAAAAIKESTLVVLPTGLGKTIVALIVIVALVALTLFGTQINDILSIISDTING